MDLGITCHECPVSYIQPQMAKLVSIITGGSHVKDISGASLFGPDASKWPAWAFDAAVVIEVERKRCEGLIS